MHVYGTPKNEQMQENLKSGFHFTEYASQVIINSCVGYEVLTVMVTKSSVFWDIILCSPLKVK
jgi:hypothetical protein